MSPRLPLLGIIAAVAALVVLVADPSSHATVAAPATEAQTQIPVVLESQHQRAVHVAAQRADRARDIQAAAAHADRVASARVAVAQVRAQAAARAQAQARAVAAASGPAARPYASLASSPPATPVTWAFETPAQRGARVLASLPYDGAALGYRIEFLPPKADYLGLTIGVRKLVQIYVRPGDTDLVLAHSIAHELGHVLDFTRGTPATRASYLAIRGLSASLPWYGCTGCADFATPAGDWAEVFAYWLAGPGDFRSQVAGPPTAAQLRALASLFQP